MVQEQGDERARRRIRRWHVAVLVVLGYAGFVAARFLLFRPELEIGRETTFVDGPLRPDGTIDYAAALNAEWSKGITPENNAAVPLAEAFGADAVPVGIREEYFRALGIDVPVETKNSFVTFQAFLREKDTPDERNVELATVFGESPAGGLREGFPELVEWVARNEGPLELVVAASRRERFFSPLLVRAPSTRLLDATLDAVQGYREAARLLRTRALLRLESGDVDGAVDDAIACHRLGRLVGRHPTMIGYLIGAAIEALAAETSEAIVLSGKLDPEGAKRFRRELERLPAAADAADTIDRGERLVSLDAVLQMANGTGAGAAPVGVLPGTSRGLDKNVSLRTFNRSYDRQVEAMREGDSRERTKKLDALAKESRTVAGPRPTEMAWAVLTGSRVALSKHLSNVLVSLLTPAVAQAQVAEDRTAMRARLTRVGAALAEYRAVEGEYPETLEVLRANYLAEIPEDFYADAPLKYRRVGDAFVVYAIGPNGRDDGGRTPGGRKEWDDVRFGVAPDESEESKSELQSGREG